MGGRDSKAQEERGGNQSRLWSLQRPGGGGRTAGCPVAVFPSVSPSCCVGDCASRFRFHSSTSFRENLPFLENAVLLAMLQLFYSFLFNLFDSASILRTVILINCESTQENTKSRKSGESHQLSPPHFQPCKDFLKISQAMSHSQTLFNSSQDQRGFKVI